MRDFWGRLFSIILPDEPEHPAPPNMTKEQFAKTVQLKKIAQMKQRSSVVILTRFLLCIFFVIICWKDIGGWVAVLWLIFILMHLLAGMKSNDDFFNSPDPEKELKFWRVRTLQLSFVSAMAFGFAGFYFMMPGQTIEQMLLLGLIIGVAVGSGTLYATWLPAFWSFMPIILLPTIAKLVLIYEVPYLVATMWLLLLFAAMFYFSLKLNRLLVLSIYRSIERDYLMQQLVHQRQTAELAKEAAEMAIVSKTRFFAAANHDLRQPLQAMGIFISLLGAQATETSKPLIDNLSKACNSVSTLVDQILILSKLDAGSVKINPVNFTIDDLFAELEAEFEPLAESKNDTLRVISVPTTINSDYQLLIRVLRNLLGNSIRYTSNGRILLRAKLTRINSLVITVSDSGKGIAAEEQMDIFKEYYRGKSGYEAKEGYGLGLSIVQKIVELLGYRIRLYSRLGRGSIFRLDIPLSHNVKQLDITRREKTQRALSSLRGKRILFIEDEPLIRSSLVALLEGWGAEVKVAEYFDAQLAADVATSKPIDLILTDFNLGMGHLTGLQSIFRIRSAVGHKIPAIIMTAVSRETVMHQYEEETEDLDFSEAGSYLTDLPTILQKPIPPEEINRTIIRVLGNKGTD